MPALIESSRFRTANAVGVAVIVAATLAVYWPSLTGPFIWDDESLVANNEIVHAGDGWYRMWIPGENIDYWPVTNDSFWVEWQLGGRNTIGYHVDNVVLHVVNSLLIWLILRRLAVPGAFWEALLFAVHPVNVESVAWIAQRKNLLAMLFGLVAVWGWLRDERRETRDERQKSVGPGWYWVSLVAFLLAMLSKGAVAFLPGVLVLIVWWKRGEITKRDWLRVAPFFLVAVAMVGVNVWSQQHAGAEPIRAVTFAQRLVGAGAAVWFYLAKGVMPVELSFIYPHWEIDAGGALWWLPLVAAVGLTGALVWQRQRRWCRAALFAWAYFCLALVPVMGFTDVYYMKYSLVADHYQYFALVGVVGLVAAGWMGLQERARGTARWAMNASGLLVVAMLMVLTWRQNKLYQDPVKLYEQALETSSGSWIVHNDLAKMLNDRDRPMEAERQLLEAVNLSPEHVEIHLNLGTAAAKQGKLDEAARHYQEAIQVDPKYPEAHFALGSVLAQLGKAQEAAEQYREAVRLEPEYTNAHLALGAALSSSGQTSEAIKEFEEVVREHPEFAEGRLQLGNAYLLTGAVDKAIEQLRAAVDLDDSNAAAHNSLGAALQNEGRHKEAAYQFVRATKLDPEDANAWGNLAAALDQLHRADEAVAAARRALELAQAQGKTELAQEIEAWLKGHSADMGSSPRQR